MSDLYVGLMSGTSLDGVDAVIADFSAGSRQAAGHLLAANFAAYPVAIRDEALALCVAGHDELDRAARLSNALSHSYAGAVQRILESAKIEPSQVVAIGCHGQTVRHHPDAGYTVQLVNAALLAEITGIQVVSDFRSRDIAAGGQGAPLVPAFHRARFQDANTHRVIVNIGGIANLTDLPSREEVCGFDTGPGNVLLDLWAQAHLGVARDDGGGFAASGRVDSSVLNAMLRDPYFREKPPKSTGRERFNQDWLDAFSLGRAKPADIQATLTELTARSIADAIATYCEGVQAVYVCGGGVHNLFLMDRLAVALAPLKVGSTNEIGLDPDWVEALAFAWLARRAIDQQPGNLPAVTGARGLRVLGAIYSA